ETPYPKKRKRLPLILSREEVDHLIESALTPFHRTILMTLYATGSRRAELANLRIADVDSQRMLIHIRGGKGRKDRDIMLGPNLLEELRQHYRRLRRRPVEWLFPGGRWHTADYPMMTRWSGTPAASRRSVRGSKSPCIRTRSGTALPPTCWRM